MRKQNKVMDPKEIKALKAAFKKPFDTANGCLRHTAGEPRVLVATWEDAQTDGSCYLAITIMTAQGYLGELPPGWKLELVRRRTTYLPAVTPKGWRTKIPVGIYGLRLVNVKD